VSGFIDGNHAVVEEIEGDDEGCASEGDDKLHPY